MTPLACLLLQILFASPQAATGSVSQPAPLVIGDTFTIASKILGETRRIDVYLPPGDDEGAGAPLPVLYMPDGGMGEDFLHVAGLVQVSVGNGTMRPFLLVGIENTERRRDMTGPTSVEEDWKIAPHVGGSAAFRAFIRNESMPAMESRYRATRERAVVGESLAGLFVVETLFLDRTCSTPTSPSIPASGGTVSPWSPARASGCGATRRRTRRCISRAAASPASWGPPGGSRARSRRILCRDWSGTTSGCRGSSTPRSIIPPH